MNDIVVLLHGLGRTPMSMLALSLAARRRGYRVINWRYRSTRRTIAEHAAAFARDVAPRLAHAPRVHFVTHSLGGIVVGSFSRLAGMRDFVVLPHTHTLPWSPDAIGEVFHFLEEGRFTESIPGRR